MSRPGVLLLLCATFIASAAAQQDGPPVPQPELDQWIRATGGESSAASDPNSDTRFLASLTQAERRGAFLFRQRCYACHYSALSPMSFGPRLSQKNVEGREETARATIADGTPRMPAFRYGLTAAQIDSIVGYLKKVKDP